MDGDARDDLVTFQNDTFFVDFAVDGFGNLNASIPLTLDGGGLGFPGVSERPSVSDMNQDGIDDFGIWVPGNLGQTPAEISEWFFLVSEASLGGPMATHVPGTPVAGNIPGSLWAFTVFPLTGGAARRHFEPIPFGTSLFAVFGDEPAFPIVGNFDPPANSGSGLPSVGSEGTIDTNNVLVVARGPGSEPRVTVYERATGLVAMDILAYDANFRGGVQVATADVNGDGVVDIITAPGPGGGPHIKVFDGATGNVIQQFMAYAPSFTGGVFLAAGDINNDGKADIVTAPGAGGGPHVRIFNGAGGVLGEYMAYSANFTGGVHVALGDVDGNNTLDVVTGPAPAAARTSASSAARPASRFSSTWLTPPTSPAASGSRRAMSTATTVTTSSPAPAPAAARTSGFSSGANGQQLHGFFAYATNFTGGVRVASGDFDVDGRADILTAPGPGGGPHVIAFDGDNLATVANFLASSSNFTGGLFVAAPAVARRAAAAGDGCGRRRRIVVAGSARSDRGRGNRRVGSRFARRCRRSLRRASTGRRSARDLSWPGLPRPRAD